MDLVALRIVPAVTGGLLAYGHVRELGSAVLVFAALLLGTFLIGRTRYPLHLMRGARIGVGLAGPLLGAVLALGVGALGASSLTPGHLVVPVIGTWLTMAIGVWASERLKSDRPVRVAVVGTAEVARSLAAELALARVRGFEALGWVGPRAADATRIGSLEWLGPVDDLRAAVLGYQIDLLVYSPAVHLQEGREELTEEALLEHVAHACLDLPVRMLDANQLYEELLGHVPIGTIDAAWFRYIMHPRYRPGSSLSKRASDLVLGLAAGLIALPIVAVAAVAIKLDSRGPVFFHQRRVGEHGREFEIVKLRTMTDVEPPEVTRVGRILRRTHINELPQLWNVLRGELSLVGPRPEPADLVASLERQLPNYERRHLVKPGITGWAQIRCGYAGSEMGSAWKLCHDLYYLKHRSLLADLLLMVETAAILPLDPDRDLRTPSHRFLVREASRA
jgi:lipopolysaccharide/colanic/teichoic acid biosynthesis glycosyltransferase